MAAIMNLSYFFNIFLNLQCYWLLLIFCILILSIWLSSLGYTVLCIIFNFLVFPNIWLSSSPVHFLNCPKYLSWRLFRCLSLWWDFSSRSVFEKLSRPSEITFSRLFFLLRHFLNDVRFQYSQVFVVFLFSKHPNGYSLSFFCLDVEEDHMKRSPNETLTHSCRLCKSSWLTISPPKAPSPRILMLIWFGSFYFFKSFSFPKFHRQ